MEHRTESNRCRGENPPSVEPETNHRRDSETTATKSTEGKEGSGHSGASSGETSPATEPRVAERSVCVCVSGSFPRKGSYPCTG